MRKLPQLRVWHSASTPCLTSSRRRRMMREDGFLRDVSVGEAFLAGMFAAYLLAALTILVIAG